MGVLEAFCDRDNFATSYLYCVIVHKDYQRRGIGTALVNAFNKRFARTTTFVVTLCTRLRAPENFYKSAALKTRRSTSRFI
ncbi:GNAT family N-acetyltransferase [uncultured Campylobacter sp.]|uniref:GNAT family N-acetyltransferase n=1 Tax=uncultured Campylobacter sp. TaxID=218934 RepID=UPI002622B4F5|nr:GNAT family N-acetyltransferase [uncultured Campylobacter sp.]